MDNELGARIRTLRKERGLSQEALAQALEVSRQAVTKWEDGSSLPSTANLFALSGFFGVPLAELTGTPEVAAPPSSASAMSEKAHVKRAKALRISAWVLLAISVPSCAAQVRAGRSSGCPALSMAFAYVQSWPSMVRPSSVLPQPTSRKMSSSGSKILYLPVMCFSFPPLDFQSYQHTKSHDKERQCG